MYRLDYYIKKIKLDRSYVYVLINDIVKNEIKENKFKIKLKIQNVCENASSYADNEVIVLNKKIIDNVVITNDIYVDNNIYLILKNLFHEIEHVKQYVYFKNKLYNDSGLFYNLSSELSEKEYIDNYNFLEVESIANINATRKLLNMCENISVKKQLELELKNYTLQSLYLYRINNKGKLVLIFDWYPELLIKIDNDELINALNSDINSILTFDILNLFDKAKDFYTKLLFNKVIYADYKTIIDKDKYIKLLCKVINYFVNIYENYDILRLELNYCDCDNLNDYIIILKKIHMLLNYINDSKLYDINKKIEGLIK